MTIWERHQNYYPILLILAFASFLRFVFLFALPDMHFGDTDVYYKDGATLFAEGQLKSHIYTPLYPIWMYITGGGVKTQLADIGLSVSTVFLIYCLSKKIFQNEVSALLAAFFAAIYPHLIFYSVSQLSETLFIFLFLLALLVLYRAYFFVGSVLLVCCILVRPSTDLVAPLIVLVFSAIVHQKKPKYIIQNMLRYGAVYLVLMSPWWIHNYVKYDAFVRLSLGDGHVLYSGNNLHNTTGGGIANGLETDDLDSTIFDHLTDPILRNEAKKDAALKFIRENPARFIELAGKKFVRFWRLWPFASEYQSNTIIFVSLLSYGNVLFLSLLFLFNHAKTLFRQLSPFFIFTGYLTLIHIVTIGSIRYRLPIEPFLIILAAMQVCNMVKHILPTASKKDGS